VTDEIRSGLTLDIIVQQDTTIAICVGQANEIRYCPLYILGCFVEEAGMLREF
jgi:hypothetical protein